MVTKFILSLAAIAVISGAQATTARAQKSGADAVQAFTVGGIRVILSPADNQLVSVVIGMEGGLANSETDNTVLGPMTAQLIASSGSKTVPKEALREFTSRTSTTYNGEGDARGISVSMTSTLSNFDKSFDVLTSMIATPLFDQQEFTRLKQQSLFGAKSRWSRAEGYAGILADSMVKLGNPVLSKWTSTESVEAVTIQAIQDFHAKLAERSRMIVVVVGKVTREDLERKLQRLNSLPQGAFARAQIPPLGTAAGPTVHSVDRPTPTAYIVGQFAGPRSGDPDWWPMLVGLNHLSEVLFREVRTKRNLSYAPGSWMSSSLGNGVGTVSVSTVYPDSAMGVIYTELHKMKNGEFDASDLEMSKQVFTTGYFMGQMTNGGKANSLYRAQKIIGDWHYAFSADKIAAVTKEEVQRAFAKYAKNLQVGFVGKKAGMTESKMLFSE